MNVNMSKEQKIIIKKARDYNVLVDCVVGSGKTTTILEIAADQPKSKILLLVYNNKLRKDTINRASLRGLTNIDIHTFHSYCYNNLEDHKASTDYDLLKIIRESRAGTSLNFKNPSMNVYDMVIIDEAQDLNQMYYEISCILLKSLKKLSSMVKICIFGDRNQSIYKYNGSDQRYIIYADKLFNFNNIQWTKETLSETFRLPVTIKNFVNFIRQDFNIVSNKISSYRPRYIICNTWGLRPYQEIKYYLDNGYSYSDILVLGPSLKIFKKIIDKLSQEGIPIYSSQGSETIGDGIGRIIFCTFHQAKGLERKVSIVFNFDDSYYKYYNKIGSMDECPNELYVGSTRSSERLSLIHDCKNNFLPFIVKRSINYTSLLLTKLCDVELPSSYTLEKIFQNKGKIISSDSDKTVSISVTDCLKHIPVSVIEKLLTFLTIDKIETETGNPIKVSKTTIGSHTYEFIADITGIAVPMYFQQKMTGSCTVKELVSQNIYSTFKLPEVPVLPFKNETFNISQMIETEEFKGLLD